MSISQSQLTLYKHCPFQYKCRYIDKIETPTPEAFAFGTEFHEAIKVEGKSENPDIKKMVTKLWANPVFAKLVLEAEFEVKERIALNGIEYVWITDGRTDTEILEFKSAKYEWKEDKFFTEWQPHVYMKLEQLRTGVLKKFNYFVIGKGNIPFLQHKIIPFNPVIWKEVEKTCKELLNDYKFNPTAYKRGRDECRWCDYKQYCEAYF